MYALNSVYLYFLPLILIPWLISKILKPKYKNYRFSSFYILQNIVLRDQKRRKRDNLLLILIRSFILLFLILYFADLHRGNSPHLKEKSIFYIYFDNSPSMGWLNDGLKQTNIEFTRNKLNEFANSKSPNDFFYLRTTDHDFRILSRDRFLDVIQEITITNFDIPLVEVLSDFQQKSKKIFPTASRKNFYYFGDGNFPIFNKKSNKFVFKDSFDTDFFKLQMKDSENQGIEFAFEDVFYRIQGSTIHCFLTIKNNTRKIFDGNILLNIEGEDVAFSHVHLDSLARKKIEMTCPKPILSIENLKAEIKVENYDDNTHKFVINNTKLQNVLVSGKLDFYSKKIFRAIFSTDIIKSNFNLKLEDIDSIQFSEIKKYSTIIIYNPGIISYYDASILRQYSKINNNKFFLIMGENLSVKEYNNNLSKEGFFPIIKKLDKGKGITNIDYLSRNNNFFKEIYLPQSFPKSVSIRKSYQLDNFLDFIPLIGHAGRPLFLADSTFNKYFMATDFSNWSNIGENGLALALVTHFLYSNSSYEKQNFVTGRNYKFDKSVKISSLYGDRVYPIEMGSYCFKNSGFYKLLDQRQNGMIAVNKYQEVKNKNNSFNVLERKEGLSFKNLIIDPPILSISFRLLFYSLIIILLMIEMLLSRTKIK